MNQTVIAAVDQIVAFAQKVTRYFSRLLWRFAFTYIIVTVSTFTVLVGVLLFISNNLANTAQMGSSLSLAMLDASGELVPALNRQPVDTAAIDDWVQRTIRGSTLAISRRNVSSQDIISYSSIAGKNTRVAVIDRQGRILASRSSDESLVRGQTLDGQVSAASQTLIENALAGETNPINLYRREDGGLISTAPIQDPDSREILGAVYVQIPPVNRWEVLLYITSATLGSGLYITVAAAIIGLIFGILVARGFVKRLSVLSASVSAWGEGNFAARIADQNTDEIGLLAQEMNKMAGHLETLFQTRQELAALEERNRLARDLHDSVKQQVFAATMNLGAVQALWDQNPEEARRRLDIAASLSWQSQQELTQLIQTLRPANLRETHLDKLLNEHISVWQRNNNVTVETHIPAKLPRMGIDTQEVLYRVCQEAFSNISRHSMATRASLDLEVHPGHLTMRISDNGIGFDPQKTTNGLGLRTMPERVHKVGGSFTIQSAPGETVLMIDVPTPNEEEYGPIPKDHLRPVGR